MRSPLPLDVGPFGPTDELARVDQQQAVYLRRYLEDLDAATLVTEPYYFDNDYLSEFTAFYSASAAGYQNVCKRLHFFGTDFDRKALEAALANEPSAQQLLRDSYLGFVVVRPIPSSPLGRTVLRWYPDRQMASTPRRSHQRTWSVAGGHSRRPENSGRSTSRLLSRTVCFLLRRNDSFGVSGAADG